MPPTPFVGESDLQGIFADALTSFSPLGVLVGTDATRSLSNHVSNSKQLMATSLVPIGALGLMSTVCKGTTITALKDLLGAGESDILDASADFGCGTLHGIMPRFSKRGGLTCHDRMRYAGVPRFVATAILRARWDLLAGPTQDGSPDFEELSKFLTTIHTSTISGRLAWKCEDQQSNDRTVLSVKRQLLRSWDTDEAVWSKDLFTAFQDCGDPEILKAFGMIELHWPTPSIPLEQNATIVFIYIAAFTIVPATVVLLSATKLLSWQTPASAALLLSGQLILSLGNFLAQWVVRRQRVSISIEIPRHFLSDTWMLVDNTWFTSLLARRQLPRNPLSPNTVEIGQYVSMNPHIPSWQVIGVLSTIAAGFLCFYIGARSSSLWVILFEIGCFFLGNLLKGEVITIANKAHVTPLNNPGLPNVVKSSPQAPSAPWSELWRFFKSQFQNQEAQSKGSGPNTQVVILDSEKNGSRSHQSLESPSDLEPWMIPLPGSKISLARTNKSSDSVREDPRTDTTPQAISPQLSEDGFVMPDLELEDRPRVPTDQLDTKLEVIETQSPATQEYRVYAKFALRSDDAIGLFFFNNTKAWGAAAHIIYETLYDEIQWTPHMRKEPLLILPFNSNLTAESPVAEKEEAPLSPSSPIILPDVPMRPNSTLILALDETINEDIFWMAGMEFMTILVGAFTDTDRLVSECEEAADGAMFGAYVYAVVRLILQSRLPPQLPASPDTMATIFDDEVDSKADLYPGVASMMRAIDLVRRKYVFDSSVHTVPLMRRYAKLAKTHSVEVF